MADDGVERGWGDPQEEPATTAGNLDWSDTASPSRGRGRGRASPRGMNGSHRGNDRGRGSGPRGSPRGSHYGNGSHSSSQPSSPVDTKSSLNQGWSGQTAPARQEAASTQTGWTDEASSANTRAAEVKETGWGDEKGAAIEQQVKKAAAPLPVEATKVEISKIDPGKEPVDTSSFAGKETGWGDEASSLIDQQVQKAKEPVPVEMQKVEIGTVDPGKEPVDMSSFAGKQTGWGDESSITQKAEPATTGESLAQGDSVPQTPSLDPTVSAFEPKKPAPALEGHANGEGEQQERERKPRREAYVNPDRVDTGGLRKAKLSPEDLATKMAKARERNAELLKKKELVDADEASWRDEEAESSKALEEERAARAAKAARLKEVQNSVDEARARNAARKMEKQQNREWDTEKNKDDFDPAKGGAAIQRSDESPEDDTSQYMWNNNRGRGRGRGRGGRGRGAGAPPIARAPVDLGDPNEFPSMFK